MLGKLTWAAIPFDEPIPLYTAAVVGLAILVDIFRVRDVEDIDELSELKG